MKLTTILILGAATLATPVFAQAAANSNISSEATATASASDNSAASLVSSVPDTEKKYKASSRASDFQKEAETTKALNQQIASANNTPAQQ